jgi:UDP:flavonoid glycosyltransferase YjiC (YdhE family)
MRVLMLAEAVTLAHVARPIALATGLAAHGIECTIATSSERRSWVEAAGLPFDAMTSLPASAFVQALARGRPLYATQTLRDYVQDDLRLLEAHRPHVVIGDFRLSLSVSARLAGVPYLTLTNAYWSPFVRLPFPMPVLPLSRLLPLPIARALFALGRPFAMPAHSRPLNQVRREHGLPSLGTDLRRVYTDADVVLYADEPQAFPMAPLPPTHHFLGPVLWSPPVALPPWWSELRDDLPIVYVTLGSSGNGEVLQRVLQALGGEPLQVIASTAGAALSASQFAPNVRCAPYLPGDQASARAALVVCNGGSMTTQQSLFLGRPVLGVASNMDQFMNMTPLVQAGAGQCLRADRVTVNSVRSAVRELLGNATAARSARELGTRLRRAGPAADRLADVLRSAVA